MRSTSLVLLLLGLLQISAAKLILPCPSATIALASTELTAMQAIANTWTNLITVGAITNNASQACSWNIICCNSAGQVTSIYAANMVIAASIPSQISTLTSLSCLAIVGTQIRGVIPSSLSALTSLTALNLWDVGSPTSSTSLTGPIPDLSNATALNTFALGSTMLSGTLPSWLGQTSPLSGFQISNCPLISGSIPSTVLAKNNLQLFQIASTTLTGSIPSTLSTSTWLTTLQITSNPGLTGALPSINGLFNLQFVQIYNNTGMAQSTLPALDKFNKAYVIQLWSNNFAGTLPANWTAPSVYNVDIHNNSISGSLPNNVTLPKLVYFWAYKNNLNGPLPKSLLSISTLTNFNVTSNSLSGTLPYNFFNKTTPAWAEFDVSNNPSVALCADFTSFAPNPETLSNSTLAALWPHTSTCNFQSTQLVSCSAACVNFWQTLNGVTPCKIPSAAACPTPPSPSPVSTPPGSPPVHPPTVSPPPVTPPVTPPVRPPPMSPPVAPPTPVSPAPRSPSVSPPVLSPVPLNMPATNPVGSPAPISAPTPTSPPADVPLAPILNDVPSAASSFFAPFRASLCLILMVGLFIL